MPPDNPNKDWDKKVSTYLLQQAVGVGERDHKVVGELGQGGSGHGHGAAAAPSLSSLTNTTWTVDTLRHYIAYVKYSFHPTMSSAAATLLKKYYSLQRQSDDRSQARTTTRLLESLVRLSESRKLMCRNVVLIEDAVVAIALAAMSGGGGGQGLFSSLGGLRGYVWGIYPQHCPRQ